MLQHIHVRTDAPHGRNKNFLDSCVILNYTIMTCFIYRIGESNPVAAREGPLAESMRNHQFDKWKSAGIC